MSSDNPTASIRPTAFRKRPVEVEAIPVREAFAYAQDGDWGRLPAWLFDAYEAGDVRFLRYPVRVGIFTLEGTMTAHFGDWIVRGVIGELYPVRADVFEATYEPAVAAVDGSGA